MTNVQIVEVQVSMILFVCMCIMHTARVYIIGGNCDVPVISFFL